MDATEDFAALLHTVTNNPAVAVRANRRERVDCALKAIEGVMLAGNDHFKRLVIFIFANFAFSHSKRISCTANDAAVSD
jgi:hypothetical protein